MSTFLNEYEGFGNALMGIGGMYYAASEKRKEEERKRKELEDERKYQATQADLEWQRKAPLETLTQELRRIQIENAKLSGQKTLVDTYRPRVDKLGTIARTTVPSFEGGQLTYESTDEPIQIPPRVERSPYERVGNDLIDTRNMQVAYKGEDKAAAEKPLYTSAQLINARQQYNKMLADQAGNPSTAQRKAMQSAVDAQAQLIKDIEAGLKSPLMKQESVPESTKPASGVKITAGGTPAKKAAFAKWTAAYEEALAAGATKEEAEILANQVAGE